MRFLFIDDEPIRALPLVKLGHEVHIACGVAQVSFYLKLSGIQFDAVWLDHDMPGMNGHEIAETFLTKCTVPVIIHSANDAGARHIKLALSERGVMNLVNNIDKYPAAEWVQNGLDFIQYFQEGGA